jgi:hypothetical protein
MNLLQKMVLSFQTPKKGVKLDAFQNDLQNKKKRISGLIQRQRIFYPEIDQQLLINAINMAEHPLVPRRFSLYTIFREVMRDGGLQSQIRTAFYKTYGSPWAVVNKKTKEIDTELTKLLQTQWFEDLNEEILNAEFWGHSIIEFQDMVRNPETNEWVFSEVELFPREHLKPESAEILINPNDTQGFSYLDSPYSDWILEAGKRKKLGLLMIVARYSIYKKYAMSDWSRSSEKWGDPLLVLGSSSDDDEENTRKQEFAENFGSNGYIITDDDDKITLLERSKGDGYKIFQDIVDKMNDEMSKVVNGQTGTQDNQAWAGTANVHADILDKYTEARLRHLYYYHNDKTFPFLINCNGGDTAYKSLKGYEWMPLFMLKEIKNPNDVAAEEAANNVDKNAIKKPKKQMPLP